MPVVDASATVSCSSRAGAAAHYGRTTRATAVASSSSLVRTVMAVRYDWFGVWHLYRLGWPVSVRHLHSALDPGYVSARQPSFVRPYKQLSIAAAHVAGLSQASESMRRQATDAVVTR